jgi:hypothetical protein
VDQLLRDPEQLRATVADVRRDVIAEARSLSSGSSKLPESLDGAVADSIRTWSFAHLLTGTEPLPTGRFAHAG